MTPHRILILNASFTGVSAVAMLVLRGTLFPLFGLDGPLLFDIVAIGLLAYAAALVIAARRKDIGRSTLLAFTIADVSWVVGSAIVLLLFWSQLAPIARTLVIAAALAVEVFATLQYRAAGSASTLEAAR